MDDDKETMIATAKDNGRRCQRGGWESARRSSRRCLVGRPGWRSLRLDQTEAGDPGEAEDEIGICRQAENTV